MQGTGGPRAQAWFQHVTLAPSVSVYSLVEYITDLLGPYCLHVSYINQMRSAYWIQHFESVVIGGATVLYVGL